MGSATQTIHLPADIVDELHTYAETMDLDTATYIRAVLTAAIRGGTIDTLARRAIDTGLVVPAKRRTRRKGEVRQWETDGENWHSGRWTLVRVGVAGPHPKPGEGWYLHGPGIAEGGRELSTQRATEAKVLADAHILLNTRPATPET